MVSPSAHVAEALRRAEAAAPPPDADAKSGNWPEMLAMADYFAALSPDTRLDVANEITRNRDPHEHDSEYLLPQALVFASSSLGESRVISTILISADSYIMCHMPVEELLTQRWPPTSPVGPLSPVFEIAKSRGRGSALALSSLRRCCSQTIPMARNEPEAWLQEAASWYDASWRTLCFDPRYGASVLNDESRVPETGLVHCSHTQGQARPGP